jgi:tetratricopeptide (TPR) repeat protein
VDASTAATLLDFAGEDSAALAGLECQAALARLDQRHAELLAALEWLLDHGRINEAMRLATSLATFWRVSAKLVQGSAWCERILATAGGDDVHRGRMAYEAGMLAFWMGNDERAGVLIGRGLEIGRRIADPTIVALALCGLARIALRSDVREARRLCHEALAVTEGTTDRLGRSSAIHVLGVTAQMAGDLEEARRFMNERIALAREMGSYAGISMESSNLSMVERQLGNLDRAEALAREALDIFHRREDRWAIPFGLNGLAAVARDRGQFERAMTMIGAAEAMVEAQGAKWPPDESVHYQQTLSTSGARLSSEEFERARALGRSMNASEAVRFALGAK